MSGALIIDAASTVFGRYRGGLSGVRVDDLATLPVTELLRRHGRTAPAVRPAAVDDVIYGNTNGAGEENRNIGRMVALLAGPAGDRAGRDGEPAVRVRRRGDRAGGAGDRRR